MHSYKNLAVLALAASAMSPALAAPVQENQNNARDLDTRAMNPWAKGALGVLAAMTLLPHLFGGGSTQSAPPASTSSSTSTTTPARSNDAEQSAEDLNQRNDSATGLDWIKALTALNRRGSEPVDTEALFNALFSRALEELD